jgi:phospholipase/carboxylesterase
MFVAPELLEAEVRARPPVLLIQGTDGQIVPFRLMDLASGVLSAFGIKVETRLTWFKSASVRIGLAAATAFARSVLA